MKTPFIVAEISANHLGSLERALHIIDAAAKAGADAVKFQTWKPGSMVVDRDYVVQSGPWAGRRLYELYEEAYTPWEWHETLYAYARSAGLVAFSSVFDRASVDFLEKLDCPIYKISSFEIGDIRLIQRAAKTGKPMIISTGMAEQWEIARAVWVAKDAGCRDIAVLKCTSAYPAPPESMNLMALYQLRACLPDLTKIGVSDHTLGLAVPVASTALGVDVIEKHLTMSRADGGPDAAFSLEPDEFAAMVTACREAHAALGNGSLAPSPVQTSSMALRRSLYWAVDAEPGPVCEGMIVSARPWGGMSPAELPKLLERTLAVPVRAGQPVKPEHFQ